MICPLCKTDNESEGLITCKCGLVYRDDYLKDRSSIYEKDYSVWGKEDTSSTRISKTNHFSYLLDNIQPKGGRLLDIGTGRGYLLDAAIEEGFDAYGIEIAKLSKDDRIFHGTLEEAKEANPDKFFDVITMTDIIEHISDPHSFFKEVRRILKPGGTILITTPNSDSFTRKIMGKKWFQYKDEHIIYWNKNSMKYCLDKYGFDIIKVENNKKKLQLRYYYDYFGKYPSLIGTMFRLGFKILPSPLKSKSFINPITGEMLVVAKKCETKQVVLVNPPLSNEERYGIKLKAGGQTPPNGLAIIAAVVRKNRTVAIIDGAAEGLNYDEIVDKILNYDASYVGLTASTVSIFNAMEIARRIKERNKNIKVILGGAHITAAPEETMEKFKGLIDYGVIREGEITFPELLTALDKKKSTKKINGLIYYQQNKKEERTLSIPTSGATKQSGVTTQDDEKGYSLREVPSLSVDTHSADILIRTPPRDYIMNLDEIPIPAWDLLPNLAEHYTPPVHTLKKFPAAMIVSSRGCSGLCAFCSNSVFGRRYRWHSPRYIINMIKTLKETYGIKEIQFKDDNLLINKVMLKELCEIMINEKINISWNCSGRIDMINPEILKLMKKAGCWQIWYGLESGSDKILKELKKNTTVEQIRYAIKITKEAGISSGGFFMIGNPTETVEDIEKTISLLLELPLDEFHISHLTPFPGCELYKTADQYGTFDRDWKKMSGWQILFVPNGLTKEQLVYYSNLAFRKFYFRPRIIWNFAMKIRSFKLLKIYFEAFLGFIKFTGQKKR